MTMTQKHQTYLLGPVMFWTVLTTLFAWLPLVRIIARPEGYRWSILELSGKGTEGPYWIFILLTIYVLILLFSASRGPRALFYPMLILWHLAVTAVVITATVRGDSEAVWQGQGLHWSIPMWLLAIPCGLFVVLAVALTFIDYRGTSSPAPAAWTCSNSGRLVASLLLLIVALILFRLGTNYNWVTGTAIVATIVHWIVLVESFQPLRPMPAEPQ